MNKSRMLSELINHFAGGNKSRFAAMLGVRPQTINTWITRETFDGELIFTHCEGISGDWLLSGEGPMLRQYVSEFTTNPIGNIVMTVKERIQQYIDSKGIKTARFEKECGMSSGYWRKTNAISADVCSVILGTYSDLSPEWVLLGNGSMLRKDSSEANPIESLILQIAEEVEKRRAMNAK